MAWRHKDLFKAVSDWWTQNSALVALGGELHCGHVPENVNPTQPISRFLREDQSGVDLNTSSSGVDSIGVLFEGNCGDVDVADDIVLTVQSHFGGEPPLTVTGKQVISFTRTSPPIVKPIDDTHDQWYWGIDFQVMLES